MVKDSTPVFVQKPQLDQSEDGRVLTFTCKITGEPKPSFTWFLNDVPVKDGGRYFSQVKKEGDTYVVSLEIDDVSMEDAGSYKITADNKGGTTSATIALKFGEEEDEEQEEQPVSGDGVAPTFTMKPQMSQSDDGSKLTIECELNSDPRPEVEWTRNQLILKDGGRYKLRTKEDGNFYHLMLEITDVNEEDGGEFKIVAKNTLGTATNTIKLNFERPKGAPHFVVDPQIEQSDDGRLLTFHCELVADPKPEIVWSKDDVKIKDGGRYKILIKQDGSNYDVKLQITDVSSEDAGEYKIYAANDLGDSKSRITLNFETEDAQKEQAPEIEISAGNKPQFQGKPIMKQSEDGHEVSFECSVKSESELQVSWIFNATQLIPNAGRFKITQVKKGADLYILTLTMKSVTPEDGGTYVVLARNSGGEEQSIINLNFDIKPGSKEGAPTFIERPNIKLEDNGRRILFEVKVMADPKPKFTWFFKDREIKDTGRYRIRTKPQGKIYILVLEVSGASPAGDAGNYKVVAENEKGKASSTINVEFKQDGTRFPKKYNIASQISPVQVDFMSSPIQIEFEGLTNMQQREIEIVSTGQDQGELIIETTKTTTTTTTTTQVVEELKDQDVMDGDNVVLRCRIEGPVKKYKWFKDGKEIKPSKEFVISVEKDVYILKITEVFPEDTGDYSIIAETPTGEVKSIAEVFVDEPAGKGKKPGSKKPDEKKSRGGKEPVVEEGITPSTEGGVESAPPVPVDEAITPTSAGGEESAPPGLAGETPIGKTSTGGEHAGIPEIQLDIGDLPGKDAPVDIEVSSTAVPGQQSSPRGAPGDRPKPGEKGTPSYLGAKPTHAQEGVEFEDGTPYFIESPMKSTCFEGQSMKAEAIVSGNPYPTVRWYNGNDEITDGGRYKITSKENLGIHTLEVKKCTLADSGIYSCKLENELGREEKVFSFVVNKKPDDELDFRALLKHRGQQGSVPGETPDDDDEFARRESKAVAPQWGLLQHSEGPEKKARAEITTPLKDTKVSEKEGRLTLDCGVKLEGIRPKWFKDGKEIQPSKKYRCLSSDHDAKLVVYDLAPGDKGNYEVQFADIAKSACKVTVEPGKPKVDFVSLIKSQEVAEGQDAKFVCELSGDRLDVAWHHNEKKVMPRDSKCELKRLGRRHTLYVRHCKAADAGEVSIKVGESTCRASLIVKSKPKIIRELAPATVVQGNPIELECEISDMSGEVTWLKEGKPMVLDERIRAQNGSAGVRLLTIEKADFEDAAEYTCKFGDLTTKAKLTVTEPPSFSSKMEPEQEVFAGEDAVFETEVDDPQAEVFWFQDGKHITPDEKHEVIVDGNKRRLIIHDADPIDNGRYACALDAERITFSNLAVQEKPSLVIPENLEDVTVNVGDPADFLFEIGGFPAPTVSWSKAGQPFEPSDRVQMVSLPNAATMLISRCQPDDSSEYTITVANKHGEESATVRVKVIDKPGTPENLKVSGYSETTVSLQWAPPAYDGNVGVSHYVVEFRENKKGQEWQEADSSVRKPEFTVPNLTEGKDYFFRVSAVNQVGSSEPTETPKPTTAKEPSEPPDSTKAPVVVDAAEGSITIEWEPPTFDGGRPISGYLIEKRETSSPRWSKATKQPVKGTDFTADDLIPGAEYEFRVSAINKAGTGQPSEPSKATLARVPIDPADAPVQPEVSEVTKSGCLLQWGKPSKDGGSPIKGYQVQKKNPDTGDWEKVNRIPIKDTQFKVPLTEGEEVELRVVAENEAGLSEPSESTPMFVAKDPEVPPTIELTCQEEISIKSGAQMKLGAKYNGCPTPTVKWSFGGEDLTSDERSKLRKGKNQLDFMRLDAVRKDDGVYTITATNPFGEEKKEVKVSILSAPGPPKGPLEPSEVCGESLVLTWQPPEDDGGSKITNYIIEKRDVMKSGWTIVNDSTLETTLKVPKLVAKSEYIFRVAAENNQGVSRPLETSRSIVAKNPYDEPGMPGVPEVVDFDNDFVELEWAAPDKDGGAKIDGYKIEKREPGSNRWTDATPEPVKGTSAKVPDLKEGKEYEFRVTAINKAGPSKPSKVSQSQLVKPKFAAPTLKIGQLKDIKVKAPQEFILEVTFDGSPLPTVAWTLNDQPLETNDHVRITNTETKTTVKVRESERADAGVYKLTLTNDSGTTTGECTVNVLGNPATPEGPIEVSDVTAESCRLTWQAPADDGGSPITNYTVEKREVGEDYWSKVSSFIMDPEFVVPKLNKGTEYAFRVRAENQHGANSPNLMSEPVLAKNPYDEPGAPGEPKILSYDKDRCELQWTEPDSDGGDKIIGYTVERKEMRSNRWVKVNKDPLPDTTYTVMKLSEGRQYQFRIYAENRAGPGHPSRETETMTAKPEFESPRIDKDSFALKDITVRAGEPYTIKVPLTGSPEPTVTWDKDNRDIKESKTLTVETNERETVINNSSSAREDSGKYKLTLENKIGIDTHTIKVTVVDKPTVPKGPIDCSDFTKESVRLTWREPEDDGGVPITGYTVEKKDAKKDNWSEAIRNTPSLSGVVNNLTYGKDYVFRVVAVNSIGSSPPLEGRPTKVKLPFDEPDASSAPVVEAIDKSSATLAWSPPASDGGSPVTGYHVEMKSPGSKEWTRVNPFPIRESGYVVPNLKEGQEYQFRVLAENEAGEGKPSRSSEPVVAKDPILPADSPSRPNVDKVKKDSVALSWTKPVNDGGSKVTDYIVEKKSPGGEFEPIMEVPARETQAVVPDLVEGEDYEFRIRAKTEVGPGKPSSAVPVTAEDKPERPSLKIDDLKDIKVKGGEPFEIPLPFTGVPKPEITWEVNGAPVKEDGRVMVKTTSEVTTLKCDSAKRSENGRFQITLKNPSGTETAKVKVTVLVEPDAPQGPLVVSDITPNQANLSWKAPALNPEDVDNYVVEKCENGTWSKVSSAVPGTTFRVRNLKEGGDYQFRVSAENQYGLSKPITSEFVTAKHPFDAPGKPDPPECTETTRSTITVTWKPPSNDGGNTITHYTLEKMVAPHGDWEPASRAPIRGTNYTVAKLKEGTQYQFRVKAVNDAGAGKPSDESDVFIAEPTPTKPKVTGDGRPKDIIAVAGEPFKVEIPFTASPIPEVTWTNEEDGTTIEPDDRVKFEEEAHSFTLKNSCAKPKDSGTYVVKLKNKAGEEEIKVNVTVVDKPGAPVGPLEPSKVTAESLTLSWKPPESDGGSRVTNYVLERRPDTSKTWTKVSTFIRQPSHDVAGLDEGVTYYFRVSAENKYGVGEPLETNVGIKAKDPYDPPEQPGKPVIKEIDRGYVSISWEPPENDGGAPITAYIVEKKDEDGDWEQCNSFPVKDTTFSISNLKENKEVKFRVKAKNKAGVSDPSKGSEFVLPVSQTTAPASPGVPEAVNVGKDSVDLEWTKPPSDGGAPVKAYKVEKRPVGETKWQPASKYPVRGTNLTVGDLEPGVEYEFQVSAENEAGVSEPAIIASPVTPVEAKPKGTVPFFEKRLDSKMQAGEGNPFTMEVKISATPEPTVKWLLNGKEILLGARHRVRQNEGECSLILDSVSEGDAGEYTCVATNPVGSEKCRGKMSVVLTPKIKGTIDTQTVEVGNPLKIKIPYRGQGDVIASIALEGQPIEEDDRVKTNVFDDYVQFVIRSADISDDGTFKVTLSNQAGADSVSFRVKVQAKPGSPRGPLNVDEVTDHTVTVSWKPPTFDGGCPIKSYVVERQEVDTPNWVTASSYVKDTKFIIQGLKKGTPYLFRVSAENEIGVGKTLEGKEPVFVKSPFDPPSAPGDPEVTEVGKDHVELMWSKPEFDGNCPIITYIIEKSEAGLDRWVRVNRNNVNTFNFRVDNLIEDRVYEFRVSALNDAGQGPASETTMPTRIKDPHEVLKPRFTENMENAQGEEGRSVKFTCGFTGKPAPEIRFFKGQRELFNNDKYSVNIEDDKATLTVSNLSDEDADEYSAEISNRGGRKYSRATLIVKTSPKIKVPSKYEGEIRFFKGEFIKIKIPYIGFPKPETSWSREGAKMTANVSSTPRFAILSIENPTGEDTGSYRLTAENEVGSDSATIRIKITDAPKAPENARVSDLSHESVTVSWTAPAEDGGTPVTGYLIERADKGSDVFTRCATSSETTCTVNFLSPNKEYRFRVKAENIIGASEPIEVTHTITTPEPERKIKFQMEQEQESAAPKRGTRRPADYDYLVDDTFKAVKAKWRKGKAEDKYDIMEELGKGPFGVVHRAVERSSGRNFAAKFINIEPKDKALLKEEMEVMGCLQHPRLQRLHDTFDQDDDQVVLILDLLSGGDAFQRARDLGSLTEDEVRLYTKQVCEGLLHIHKEGYMHLNMKPQNILYETKKSDSLKIIDFGLAIKLDPDERAKIVQAKPGYSAPEVLNNDAVGFGTDMWTVGVIVYTLLSGIHPFEESADKIKSCDWSFDRSAFRDISEDAQDFISKLLVKSKDDRMGAHDCLDHPWLKGSSKNYKARIDVGRHKAMCESEDWIEGEATLPIGRIAAYGAHRRRRPLQSDVVICEARIDKKDARPRFLKRPHNLAQMEDRDISFQCHVAAPVDSEVTWYHNGEVIRQSLRHRIDYDKIFHNLNIMRVSEADQGEYTVKAVNQYGEMTHTMKVEVAPDPLKRRVKLKPKYVAMPMPEKPRHSPEFTFQLRSRGVQEGSHGKLSCIVQAYPPAKVRWLFNGNEVTRSDPDMKLEFSYGMASLEIDRVMGEHSGKYTCIAYNEVGEATTECMVRVQVGKEKAVPRGASKSRISRKTKKEDFDEEFEEFKRQEDEDIAARKIQRGLKTMRSRSRTDEEDEHHREHHEEHHHEEHHEVHEDGFHEERHVQRHEERHEESYEEHQDDTSSGQQVEITDVTEETHEENEIQEGEEGAEDEGDVDAAVTTPHAGYKGPVVVVKPENITVDEGQCAKFYCKLSEEVDVIEWMLDDRIIEDGGRFKVFNEGPEYFMQIPMALAVDDGTYVFRAKNTAGECKTCFTLFVRESEDAAPDVDVAELLKSVE
ncbi:twitchin-like isoform X8 [Apostichopus japonicus]|uniref:twitchin-like isoform X8 n=1 Tax=Stichopus japonicus TaxID=307972 RepID=UPI003AB52B5E